MSEGTNSGPTHYTDKETKAQEEKGRFLRDIRNEEVGVLIQGRCWVPIPDTSALLLPTSALVSSSSIRAFIPRAAPSFHQGRDSPSPS